MEQEKPKNLFGNPQNKENNPSLKKYPALETIMTLNKIFAIIVGVAVFFMIAASLEMGGFGLLMAIPALVVGLLIILFVLARNETIKVVIDIESNTRNTSNQKGGNS